MNFYSLKDKTHKATFGEAVVNGLAPNEALYFPETIPQFDKSFFDNIHTMTLQEVAETVLSPYVDGSLTKENLQDIIPEVFNFPIPLVEVEDNIFTLELFHGPTLAFKDIGARFLAKSMQYLRKSKKIRVLVATSGDTGSAVANGFLGVEGTEVVVLYPKGKVSELQQKQFTTLGQNIKPIAIDGTFDDCQRLVKSAFMDKSLNDIMNLTSANSINVARWIPQSVYYYWAYAQFKNISAKLAITVPSGNIGNITSGLLALKTGLPVSHFIASSNANKIIPDFLKTGVYKPKPSIQTIANAMDVGDPNNFPRMQKLYDSNYEIMKKEITGYAYSDDEIRDAIRKCYTKNNYLLDPHGATGYMATKSFIEENSGYTGIFLETAHPGKFYDDVKETIGGDFELPEKLQEFAKRTAEYETMSKEYETFKQYLIDTL